MADEATGQGAATTAAAPAATQAPATTAVATDTTTAAVTDAAAGTQEAQQAVDGQQTDAPLADEFGDLFNGEEPAPEGDPAAGSADLQQYLTMNPNVNTPELLAGAVADAGLMWDVIKGSQPPSSLFETLRANNPQAWQNVMQGISGYLEQITGMKLVDPATAGDPAKAQTPEQQRIAALEQNLQQERQQREDFALSQRVNVAQKRMVGFVSEALKGSFMEGSEDYARERIGAKLAGREQEVIDAIQKGDTSMIDRALKQVKHEERIRFNQYGKRLAAQRKGLQNSLPKADGTGGPPDARAAQTPDLTTREGRLKYMEQQLTA